jgi:hypothetical protein
MPVLIEVSGGICFNSTPSKEQGDEEKMIKSMIKLLEYDKYVRKCKSPVPQFYCRFFCMLMIVYILIIQVITNIVFRQPGLL